MRPLHSRRLSTPETILDRARELHRSGDLERAIRLYRQGLAARPRLGGAWLLYGMALEQAGLVPASAEALRRAVSLLPDDAAARQELAAVERRLGRLDESLDVHRDAIRRAPEDPSARRGLVNDLITLHRVAEALAEAREGLAAIPDDPPLLLALARLAERAGDPDGARAAAERLLTLDPGDGRAALVLSRLDRAAGRSDDERRRLERIMADHPGDEAGGMAMLDRAALLERGGEHEGAFELAARGKRTLFSLLPPGQRDTSLHPRFYETLRSGVTAPRVASWPSVPASPPPPAGRPPVFIVGFPRTGTTLLEQMLAAHPRFTVTDELPLLQPARDLLHQDFVPRRIHYPDWLGHLTARQVERAREAYFARARWHLGHRLDSTRLVDKHPLNTADLCFVRRIFPDSPVVVVLRDPRDTCLSCFMQPMREVPAFYDLRATAELYASLMSLWLHYKSTLGLRAMELRYEDLVTDPERAARAVLAHLEEPWDDAVLRPHEHRRVVTTPSYHDVARPIYRSAVARWRAHEQRLREAESILRPFIEAFGYPVS